MHPSNPFPSSQPFYLNHKLPGFKTMGSFKKMAVFSFSILLILMLKKKKKLEIFKTAIKRLHVININGKIRGKGKLESD